MQIVSRAVVIVVVVEVLLKLLRCLSLILVTVYYPRAFHIAFHIIVLKLPAIVGAVGNSGGISPGVRPAVGLQLLELLAVLINVRAIIRRRLDTILGGDFGDRNGIGAPGGSRSLVKIGPRVLILVVHMTAILVRFINRYFLHTVGHIALGYYPLVIPARFYDCI